MTLSPIELPANWPEYVQEPQTEKKKEKQDLTQIRTSVEIGLSHGTANWLTKTVTALGLESLIHPKDRPKKKKESE